MKVKDKTIRLLMIIERARDLRAEAGDKPEPCSSYKMSWTEAMSKAKKEMQFAAPKPAAPKQTKPAAPKQTKPAAPEQTKPTAPKQTKPTAPKQTKPMAPEQTKPMARFSGKLKGGKVPDDEIKLVTSSSLARRTEEERKRNKAPKNPLSTIRSMQMPYSLKIAPTNRIDDKKNYIQTIKNGKATFKAATGYKFVETVGGFDFYAKQTKLGSDILEAKSGVVLFHGVALQRAMQRIKDENLTSICAWNVNTYGLSPAYEYKSKAPNYATSKKSEGRILPSYPWET